MITLLVGGQFGGEGKGKIASALSFKHSYDIVCRCGGVNSSHTVVINKNEIRLRMLPASTVVDKKPLVVFGPGTLIHIDTLFDEIKSVKYNRARIKIDPKAGVVSQDCIREQRRDKRYTQLGSTLTGTGYAAAKRAQRYLRLARDYKRLAPFMDDTAELLFQAASKEKKILVEGHQGVGLSNYHGDYPYTSSRDCTTAELFSEIGLSTRWPHRVILVIKMFPTRNHAGTLSGELSEKHATAMGISEYGGGSWGIKDKRRRVGLLDYDQINHAIRLNTPDALAITGIDYLDKSSAGVSNYTLLGQKALELIKNIEKETKRQVRILSTGPGVSETIFLGNSDEHHFWEAQYAA